MDSKKFFLLAGMLLLCVSIAFTQEEDIDETLPALEEEPEQSTSYYFDYDSGRFIQTLRWEKDEYALRYVVIIEQLEEDNRYREIERINTEESFVEVSLTWGNYRYMIEVYDLLDVFSFATEWQILPIFRALQPELTGFSPAAFWLDEDFTWEIALRGHFLLNESEYYLMQDSTIINSQSRKSEGESALVVFSRLSLIPGEYEIYVRNPGGLESKLGTFTIGYRKPFDLNISIGYAPIIPLYGFLFKDENKKVPFSDGIYPAGAAVKISFIPFKRPWGNLGIGLSSSYTYLEHQDDLFIAKSSFINIHGSLLYQLYFNRRTIVFNAGLGFGITSPVDFYFEYPTGYSSEKISVTFTSFMAELSLMVFIVKPFYVSAGIDFIHIFTPEEDRPMPGKLRPFIMAGIQL
jgi:hypothetical protein